MSRGRSSNAFDDVEPPPVYKLVDSAGTNRYSAPAGPPPPQGTANPFAQTRHSMQGSSATQPINIPTPSSPNRTSGSLNRSNTQENQLAALRRFDTILLIDDSASMRPLWLEAMNAIRMLVDKVVQYDSDGIDIYFLCSMVYQQNCASSRQAEDLFQRVQPLGENTPTEIRVEELLSPYVDACERAKKAGGQLPKPLNLLCITDGQADDPDSLAYILASFADRLEESRLPLTQLGVQFVQIGSDAEATEALRQLDDDLQNNQCKRDIVDTIPYQGQITAEWLIKALLGAINKRMDARSI